MTTTLKAIDGHLAIIIDSSTLDALGIDERTPLDVTIEEGGIRIRPAADDHRNRVLASALRMMNVHNETFRRLAE